MRLVRLPSTSSLFEAFNVWPLNTNDEEQICVILSVTDFAYLECWNTISRVSKFLQFLQNKLINNDKYQLWFYLTDRQLLIVDKLQCDSTQNALESWVCKEQFQTLNRSNLIDLISTYLSKRPHFSRPTSNNGGALEGLGRGGGKVGDPHWSKERGIADKGDHDHKS